MSRTYTFASQLRQSSGNTQTLREVFSHSIVFSLYPPASIVGVLCCNVRDSYILNIRLTFLFA